MTQSFMQELRDAVLQAAIEVEKTQLLINELRAQVESLQVENAQLQLRLKTVADYPVGDDYKNLDDRN